MRFKNKLGLGILTLILFALPLKLQAAKGLLETWVLDAAMETAAIRLMSKSGREAYQEFRNLMTESKRTQPKWVVVHDGFGDKRVTAFMPTTLNGGVIHQVEVSDSGQVTRRAFKLPPVAAKIDSPSDVILEPVGYEGALFSVERRWQSLLGQIKLIQTFDVKKIDGKEYVDLMESVLKRPPYVLRTVNHGSDPLRFAVDVVKIDSAHPRFLTEEQWGSFEFPEISGTIIGNEISSDGSLLTLQSSNGYQYAYRLKSDGKKLTAIATKLPEKISLERFLVQSEIAKGRIQVAEEGSAHGINLDDPNSGVL